MSDEPIIEPVAEAPAKSKAAKAAAQAAPAAAEGQPASKGVKAVHCINHTIAPGTMFRPASEQELNELEALGAVEDLDDGEKLVFEQIEAAQAAKADPVG